MLFRAIRSLEREDVLQLLLVWPDLFEWRYLLLLNLVIVYVYIYVFVWIRIRILLYPAAAAT